MIKSVAKAAKGLADPLERDKLGVVSGVGAECVFRGSGNSEDSRSSVLWPMTS